MSKIEKLVDDLSSLTVMEAAEVFYGQATHTLSKKRVE